MCIGFVTPSIAKVEGMTAKEEGAMKEVCIVDHPFLRTLCIPSAFPPSSRPDRVSALGRLKFDLSYRVKPHTPLPQD